VGAGVAGAGSTTGGGAGWGCGGVGTMGVQAATEPNNRRR